MEDTTIGLFVWKAIISQNKNIENAQTLSNSDTFMTKNNHVLKNQKFGSYFILSISYEILFCIEKEK